jgi:hypothetical protein
VARGDERSQPQLSGQQRSTWPSQARLLLSTTGHPAERFPTTVTATVSLSLTRRRSRSQLIAPALRYSGHLLRRTLPPALLQACLLFLLLAGLRAPAALLFLASLPLVRSLLTLRFLAWPA